MKNEVLFALIRKMRDILEMYYQQMDCLCMGSFPQNSCEPASTLAYFALKDLEYADTCMYKGDIEDGTAHYWLKTDGIYIDMTYDQKMVAGNKLYGFTLGDAPYSKWTISKVSHGDVLEKISRFKLLSDIEKFIIEVKDKNFKRLD